MKKTICKEVLTALLAFLMCLCILPSGAQAADPAPVSDANLHLLNHSDQKPTNPDKPYLVTAAANPGEGIKIYVPIKNYGGDIATNVTCTLPVSATVGTSIDSPFVISAGATEIPTKPIDRWDEKTAATDGKWSDGTLIPNARGYFQFNANLLPTVSIGQHWLIFVVRYEINNVKYYNEVDIWFNVTSPVEPTAEPIIDPVTPSSGGSGFKSKPKVIIQSYSFSEEKLFAGDTFSLGIVLRNTSDKEAVKNLEISFTSDAGVVTPGSGGSNSYYAGELAKGSSVKVVIPLQIAPDAEAKAQLLSFEITYDGTKNKQEFTTKTSVTVPVQQKIRVRCDNPVIYDEAWEGQSVNMSVQMFNLGKSTLYNCMVEVQGKGLSLEETYYGGNIASGGTMRADLVLNTASAGEIDAMARITYEDVYGDPYEQLLPFHISVSNETPMMMTVSGGDALPAMETGEPEKSGGGTGMVWAIGGLSAAAAGTLIALLAAKAKKRRARELEDL